MADLVDAATMLRERSDRLRLAQLRPAQRPVHDRDRRYVRHVLQALLVVVVVAQRIVVPIGSLSVSFVLMVGFVGLAALRIRGGIRWNRVRTELYIVAGAGVLAATWCTSLLGNDVSMSSLLLLLVLYLPWVFCVSAPYLDQMQPVLKVFVRLMTVLAVVGVGQMAGQLLLGWRYTDYLARWLGEDWTAQNYNTTNVLKYGSPIVKANAFVCLEPSFLCQLLALALIISLLVKAPAWQPLVLGLGMAATLSGTGILLVAVGIAVMLVRVPWRIRPSYVIAGVLGLVIVFQTPAASILIGRRDETSQQGSSGYLRFVQPYQEVAKGLSDDPTRYLTGAGAGASERLLTSDRDGRTGEAVVYGIAPKLAFEYGLIAAVLFVAFLLVAILRGPPLPVLPASGVFMIFFLSGSLLQPQTILLTWLLTSIWGPPVTIGISDSLAGLRRRQSAVTGP